MKNGYLLRRDRASREALEDIGCVILIVALCAMMYCIMYGIAYAGIRG